LIIQQEFGALCQCLTLNRLDEHPLFVDWTISQGRIACFREIRAALLGRSESPSDWTGAGSEAGLEATVLLALQQLLYRREVSDEETPFDSQCNIKTVFDSKTRCIVPSTRVHAALDYGAHGPNINILNKISVYRRFDQKSPFEKPTLVPARAAPVALPHSNSSKASHVFDFISDRDEQRDAGNEMKAGVAETKYDDSNKVDSNRIPDRNPAAPTADITDFPQQGALKAPRRPPPIPTAEAPSGGNAVPDKDKSAVQDLEMHDRRIGNEKQSRGAEELVERVKDPAREAVAFFVDVGPTAGKPRNTNSRFSAAGKERGHKDAKEDPHAAEVYASEQRFASDRSKVTKHAVGVSSAHDNENTPSMLLNQKGNSVIEESLVNGPQPRIRESPLFPPTQRNDSVHSDAENPRVVDAAKKRIPPLEKVAFSPVVLYATDCPLRCVSFLSSQLERESSARNFTFAVGSNSKCVQTFSVSDADLLAPLPAYSTSVRSAVDVVAREKEFLNIHKGSVYALDWLSSHQLLVSGSNDKCLKICK
jgi:hypothetical protein